jgi:hypothetical protein
MMEVPRLTPYRLILMMMLSFLFEEKPGPAKVPPKLQSAGPSLTPPLLPNRFYPGYPPFLWGMRLAGVSKHYWVGFDDTNRISVIAPTSAYSCQRTPCVLCRPSPGKPVSVPAAGRTHHR